jgi:hypothetical protein
MERDFSNNFKKYRTESDLQYCETELGKVAIG